MKNEIRGEKKIPDLRTAFFCLPGTQETIFYLRVALSWPSYVLYFYNVCNHLLTSMWNCGLIVSSNIVLYTTYFYLYTFE